jgi:hypothetical protein
MGVSNWGRFVRLSRQWLLLSTSPQSLTIVEPFSYTFLRCPKTLLCQPTWHIPWPDHDSILLFHIEVSLGPPVWQNAHVGPEKQSADGPGDSGGSIGQS